MMRDAGTCLPPRRRLRDEDVPPDTDRTGTVDAGHPPDRARVRPRGIDDDRRRRSSRASSRPRSRGPPRTSIPVTSSSRSIVDAGRLRRLREPHRHAVGIGDAVALAERRAEHAVGAEPRREPRGSRRRRATATSTPRLRCSATLRRNVSTLAWVESRNRYPSWWKSIGLPDSRPRTARAARSTRSTGGCSPRSRTGGGRRRRCGPSIRSPAASRARGARRRSCRGGQGGRRRSRPCTRRR